MNRERLLGWFASAGLVLVPAAGLPGGGGISGARAPAAAASRADSGDADGAAAPSGARPNWKAEGNQPNASFGASVATAGDVNGDGYDDVIVGEPFEQHEVGRAFVYHGSASGLSTTPAWRAESDDDDDHFGSSVGTAGDVNGDGYDDVIVGALWYNNGQSEPGRAFVYYGSASGLSATANWTAESDDHHSKFGGSVGTAGDINGDGYDDVIVGARDYSHGEDFEGRAFVYHGSASGLSATANWTAESDQAVARFGSSVGTAGDVNGDGYDDVIVGAADYDRDCTSGTCKQKNAGRAFVYYGSASGLSTTADWTAESDQTCSNFGESAGTAGDVNGDGYDDVIVGAAFSGCCCDEIGEERAFVYYGSASGLSTTANWTAEANQAAGFAESVATAGDVNGDGYDDVLVGASRYNGGSAFVYFGWVSGLATTPYWMAESDQQDAYFGGSVGTAGDVNGDGYDDGIGGASGYDHGETDEGMAVVFHGRATSPPR